MKNLGISNRLTWTAHKVCAIKQSWLKFQLIYELLFSLLLLIRLFSFHLGARKVEIECHSWNASVCLSSVCLFSRFSLFVAFQCCFSDLRPEPNPNSLPRCLLCSLGFSFTFSLHSSVQAFHIRLWALLRHYSYFLCESPRITRVSSGLVCHDSSTSQQNALFHYRDEMFYSSSQHIEDFILPQQIIWAWRPGLQVVFWHFWFSGVQCASLRNNIV